MKEQTNRPRFNLVSAFIAMLGVQSIISNKDNKETQKGFSYGGFGAHFGAPIYTPKRTKFKGYMRSKQYKAKH